VLLVRHETHEPFQVLSGCGQQELLPDVPQPTKGLVGLIIQVHGWFLRLHNSVGSLAAFAMYTAFPCPDYYQAPPPRSTISRLLVQLGSGAEQLIRVSMFQLSTFIS